MPPMPCWSPAPRSACSRRLGKTEHLERSEGRDLGLRVFVGKRSAIVSSTAVDPAGFAAAGRAGGRHGQGGAGGSRIPASPTKRAPQEDAGLDLADAAEPDAAELIARARVGRGCRPRGRGRHQLRRRQRRLRPHRDRAGHLGRLRRPLRPHQPLGLRDRAGRRRHRHAAGLRLFQRRPSVRPGGRRARSAAMPASARWRGSTRPGRKPRSMPVVFDPRVAGSLLGHLAGAINGASVARGTRS